jgi:integrase
LTGLLINGGRKPKRATSFIFDILEPNDLSDVQIYRNINQAINTINRYMKRIAENLKLDRVPTTNFARHSFSTVLKRAGVSIEMISEQLGQSSINTTQIYLDSFESGQKREITKFTGGTMFWHYYSALVIGSMPI